MSSSDTRAALQAHKLSFRVAGRERALVEQVDLQLYPGELVGLIGPNGAGKSTLMRLLLGWLPPSAGSVSIHGRALAETGARERARQLAYMGQHSSLSFPFTAVEIVEMGSFPVLGLGRRPGRFERRQAMEALHYVELGHAAGQNFMTLSGGEQQLVLFARVLVQDSPIILLDEPTANLDLGHEAQLLRMTRELCREGRSVLAAMHNLNSAAEYCDRLILLHEGRIAAAGTPDEVLTAERIEQHYHTPVRIGTNETTGSRTVSPAPAASSGAKPRVHIIGGAGSAVTLTRHLHLLGIPVSGGVAHALDNDARLWRALDIPYIEVPAFAEIDEAACTHAAELQDQAEITVLCAFPFGPGNLGNLRLAERAKQLLILDDASGTCQRAFFAPGSRERFQQLTAHNPTLGYEQAVARLAGKDL